MDYENNLNNEHVDNGSNYAFDAQSEQEDSSAETQSVNTGYAGSLGTEQQPDFGGTAPQNAQPNFGYTASNPGQQGNPGYSNPNNGQQTNGYGYNYNPYVYPPQPMKQPKKKKKKTGWLIAVLVAVAIVGAGGGVMLTRLIDNISERNAVVEQKPSSEREEAPEMEKPQEQRPEEAPVPESPAEPDAPAYAIETTPLPEQLTSNDVGKSLTPAQVYEMNVNAVVGIRTEVTTNVFGQVAAASSAGTGFVLTEDGYIVTNNHVVADANTVKVALYDGTQYEAMIVGTDKMNDVALLKIDATGLQPVTVGDTEQVVVGEEVIAIGNPLGELTFTMTQGYVSALDREINTDGTPINMFQTDAAINSGNSGGPLFDMNGNVIGVTTAKYSGSTSSGATIEGIGFAIPINDVLRIVYDIQENGYVTGRAYLGVSVKDMDAATAQAYNLPTGAYIISANPDSCAEKAGIEPGDIVIGLGDYKFSNTTGLTSALLKYRAGDTTTVRVFRAGAELELELTFDERPQEEILDQQLAEQQQQQQTQPEAETPYSYGELPPDMEEFFKDYYGFDFGG